MTTPKIDDMSREELLALAADLLTRADGDGRHLEEDRAAHDLRMHQRELERRLTDLQDTFLRVDAARRHYEELYEYSPALRFTVDEGGRIEDLNLTAASLLGADRVDLIGKRVGTLCVAADRLRLEREVQRCIRDDVRVSCDVRLPTPLGDVPYHLIGVPLLSRDGGRPVRCKLGLVDVSSLKRSEERLRLLADASVVLGSSFEIDRTLATVVRSLTPAFADVAFVDLVDGGTVRRVEVSASPGTSPAFVERLRSSTMAPTDMSEPLLLTGAAPAALAMVLGEGADCARLIEEARATSIMFVPMRIRDRAVGLLGLVSCRPASRYTAGDLTFATDLAMRAAMAVDNARLYRRANQALQARQDILSVVSHDLKTPLSSLLISARMMAGRPPAAERRKARTHLERINQSAAQMQRIIDDLLDAASIDAGRLSIDRRDHEAGRLIREAVALLQPLAMEKSIRLEAEPLGEAMWVVCDAARVVQVLTNLIGNAIKFAPESGTVTVGVALEAGFARFRVHDDGPGIPKSVMRKLFERFVQAKETKHRGRGLGLYISKGIIDAQGGTIWLESEPGLGTAAYFTLPLGQPPAESVREAPPVVLIVEDDAVLRDSLRDVLLSHAYAVAVASNGREALDYLSRCARRPTLLVLDLNLPEMDGREFLRELRRDASWLQVPVIVVSGAENADDEALALGASACLHKPIEIPALVAALACRVPARSLAVH